jgi:hypothetical protein
MMHPVEGTLQALLDDEVRPIERADLERHVVACDACTAQLQALRTASAGLTAALGLIDEPAPVEQARWRFQGRRRRGTWIDGTTLRRTAVLLVGTAAVLSAAVPGSPVREWLSDRWGENENVAVTTEPTTTPEAEPSIAAAESGPAGVSVRPTDGRMRVVLRDLAPGVRLRVQLHDGERVGVWATGEAAQARFRTAPERIEVEGASAGELLVEIPRASRHLTMEVNGRVYLLKDGDQLRFPGPAADTAGPEILFEVQP